MQRNAPIKATRVGIAIALLVAVVAIGLWLSSFASKDDKYSIALTKEIRRDLYLYIIRNEDGGATVPYLYRYYFWNENINFSEISVMMNRQAPFLIADNDSAEIHPDGDVISIIFNGRIFKFLNLAVFYVEGRPHFVAVALSAQPAFSIP
jgi:hypothetical protein